MKDTHSVEEMTEAELRGMISEAEAGGNGTIDSPPALIEEEGHAYRERNDRGRTARHDQSSGGRRQRHDGLPTVLSKMRDAHTANKMTEAELQDMMNEADVDGYGMIASTA